MVAFGKLLGIAFYALKSARHQGSTFSELYKKDPEYCEFVVNSVLSADKAPPAGMAAFAAYVLYSTNAKLQEKAV